MSMKNIEESPLKIGANTAERLGLAQLYSSRLAPTVGWTDMGGSEHFAQFYKDDSYIVNSIAEYVIHGLKSGDACIVVADGGRLTEIEKLIRGFIPDFDAARSNGSYSRLDAQATLSLIMKGDEPDTTAFVSVIGPLVEKAATQGRNVRIYGEMVGLLCSQQNYSAAIKLEELWNDLKKDHSFSLFCGYPMAGLGDQNAAEYMSHICDVHTNVIPDESYTSLSNLNERLRAIAMLQQRAQQLEAEVVELEQRISQRQMTLQPA